MPGRSRTIRHSSGAALHVVETEPRKRSFSQRTDGQRPHGQTKPSPHSSAASTEKEPTKGKRLIVTAGATIEAIDPVEFCSRTHSSGRWAMPLPENWPKGRAGDAHVGRTRRCRHLRESSG